MKLWAINHHAYGCEKASWRSTNYFVFQVNYEFFLVTYCGCLENYNHLDFKLEILNKVAKKKRGRPSSYGRDPVSKANVLKDVCRNRKLDILLGRKTDEICYEYSDNAGKGYCMVREHSFLQYLKEATEYKERWRDSTERVQKSELIDDKWKDYIKERLWDLYFLNSNGLDELTDIQMVTLTALLSKHFVKNLINDNNSNEQLRHESCIK